MNSRQVSSETSTDTGALRRSVDRDKDEVCLDDGLVDLGGEKEVLASLLLDNLFQTGLEDGKVVRIPGCDSVGVDIDDSDLAARQAESKQGSALYPITLASID